MADSQIHMRWLGEGLRFEAEHPSHTNFKTDGDGKTAHSPVQSLLLALAGCTGADVIDIVTKMRVPISGLEMFVEGDRNSEPPRFFKAIRMRYVARGVAPEDRAKVERAIELSHEKYCSVYHSLRKDISVTNELELA